MQTTASVKVARGATYLLLQDVVSNLLMVMYFAFAARLLPTTGDLGVVTALSLLSSLVATFSSLAIPSALTKYVSEYKGKGRMDVAKGISKIGCGVGIVIALLFSSISFVASPFLSVFLLGSPSKTYFIQLLAIDIFPAVLIAFLGGIIYGLQDFRKYCLLNIPSIFTRFGFVVFFLSKGMGIIGILIGWIIGDYLFLTLVSLLTYTTFKEISSTKFALKSLAHYSAPLYGWGILSYFSQTIDRYMILGLAGTSVLGVYSVAATAAGAAGIVSGALSNALFPQLTEMYARQGKNELKNACKAASRYLSLIYIPLAFGLAVTAIPTLSLLAGDRYAIGAPALAIIAIASAATCLSTVFNNALMSLGETRIFPIAGLAAIITNGLFCFLLIGNLGSVGAAIARASLIIVLFTIPALRLRGIMGLGVDFKAYLNSLIASVAMVSVVFFTELIVASKYGLPLYVLLGAAVYVLTLRLLKALNQNDIALIGQYLPFNTKKLGFLVRILVSKDR